MPRPACILCRLVWVYNVHNFLKTGVILIVFIFSVFFFRNGKNSNKTVENQQKSTKNSNSSSCVDTNYFTFIIHHKTCLKHSEESHSLKIVHSQH